jgi:hypothetical protein
VKNEDRQYIASLLEAGQKPDSVAHSLLMRRALAEVETVAREMAVRERMTGFARQREYVTILGPRQEPVMVEKNSTVELWQRPARQEYRVRLLDFAAFCKSFGLDEKAMREVIAGNRRDAKGYECLATYATNDRGVAWVDPEPQKRAIASRKAVEAQGPRIKESVYSPSLPVIEWTPQK